MVWDVSPILFSIGPVTIRYYGLLFVFTILGGFHLWRWQMLRGGHGEERAEAFFWYGIVAVIVGARLGHVWFYEWDRFVADPLYVIYIWRGGLASHGATIGLIVALWLFARNYKTPLFEIFDRFSFSAAWGSFMVRIGNFFNSEIVGRPSDVPWCVKFPRSANDYGLPLAEVPCRHPSQIYETLMGIGVLLVLLAVDKAQGERRRNGILGSLFMILYFVGRFCVEYVKEYQGLDPSKHPLTEGQYLSIPFILIGFAMLAYTFKMNQRPIPPDLSVDKPAKKQKSKKK